MYLGDDLLDLLLLLSISAAGAAAVQCAVHLCRRPAACKGISSAAQQLAGWEQQKSLQPPCMHRGAAASAAQAAAGTPTADL